MEHMKHIPLFLLTFLFCLAAVISTGLLLTSCIQTNAQCASPKDDAEVHQEGESENFDGVKAQGQKK